MLCDIIVHTAAQFVGGSLDIMEAHSNSTRFIS